MTMFRSALFFLYFALMSATLSIVFTPLLLGPSRWSAWVGRTWSRATFFGLRAIAGLRYEVRGCSPAGGSLVAMKHMSMWDTMAIHTILGNPAIVLKRQLLFVPFYGWYLMRAGMIPISREGGAQALKRMAQLAQQQFAQSRSIVIFPEGTRKKPHAATNYKSGVAALYGQLNVACTPVALNSGLFWTGPGGFVKKPGQIIVEFLEPIQPGLKRRAFMQVLEQRIEDATGALIKEGEASLARRGLLT